MICDSCNKPIKKLVGVCDNKDCISNPIHRSISCQNSQCKSKALDPTSMGNRKYQYLCRTCGNLTYAHHTANGVFYKS